MHRGERLRMPLVIDRAAWLEALCRQQGEGEIAHIGCADSPYTSDFLAAGMLLHARLVRAGHVTGFDVDAPALELLRAALPGERFVLADIALSIPEEDLGRYGLVIAGEVLEHVPDADAFLRGCARLLRPGGRLCVTVPNACSPKIGLRALLGRESVNPDHRTYYGPRTLTRTLAGAGYQLESLSSCFAPVAGPTGRRVINPLLRASHGVFHGPVGDGLIAVARANGADPGRLD
jgi:SAM-dependent methyltransferase